MLNIMNYVLSCYDNSIRLLWKFYLKEGGQGIDNEEFAWDSQNYFNL